MDCYSARNKKASGNCHFINLYFTANVNMRMVEMPTAIEN